MCRIIKDRIVSVDGTESIFKGKPEKVDDLRLILAEVESASANDLPDEDELLTATDSSEKTSEEINLDDIFNTLNP